MNLELRTPEGKFYVPSPKQALFHASGSRHRALIGAFGSGKSLSGAVEALVQSLEYPGKEGQGVVARYEYKQLLDTSWKTLLGIIPKAVIRDVVKSQPLGPKIILKNGFEISGWNLKDHEDFSSLNLAWLWIDECNQEGIELPVYRQLRGRLRDTLGSRQSWLTGNPAGKNWVYEYFFAHAFEPGKKRYLGHEGWQMTTRENVHLPHDYVDDLREFYDDVWIEKFLEGSFDVYEGQVFDNFDRGLHVVSPLRVPDPWPRFRGVDHGLVNPTACLWLATDFEGNMLAYRNYYQRNAIPAENARNILKLSEGEVIEWTVIDPSTRQQQTAGGTAERLIDQYRHAGLACQEGNNHVRDSIARIRQLLQPDPEHRFPAWHPRAGAPGSPHLFFTADCTEMIWELSQYQWKQVRPGAIDREIPLAKHDHLIACLRYLVMRSPRPARETLQKNDYQRFLDIVAEFEGRPPHEEGGPSYADVMGNEHLPAGRL